MTTGYIDISQAQTPAEMVFLLSNDLESGNFNSKKIVLNMGKLEANQSQILSLKSLIGSVDSEIDFVYTESATTKLAALNLGIAVANGSKRESLELPVSEPEEEVVEAIHPANITEEEAVDILFSSQGAHVDNLQSTLNVETEEELPAATDSQESQEQNIEKAELDLDALGLPEISQSENVYVPLQPMSAEAAEAEEEKEAQQEAENVSEQTPDEEEKEYILSEDIKNFETVYVKQTVRSGQVVSHDGNVVIIGDCNPGSEIIASGDITVWGELKGIAHAGAEGNEKAVIRALKLDAIQLRISGCYARRPDRANIEFASALSDTFTPEEARIQDGEILVFTMNSDKIK